MPDNVGIASSGATIIATDQVAGGAHVQLVKLVDGAADSIAPAALGAAGDSAWEGDGDASLVAVLKRLALVADGWQDAGGPAGSILTRRADADAVMVPLPPLGIGIHRETFGSGAATLYSGSIFTSNPDGSGAGGSIAVPAGINNGLRFTYPFVGRLFGVRWNALYDSADFTVTVDGEAVRVPGWPAALTDVGITTQIQFHHARLVTHDDLDPNKPHVAVITFVSHPTTARAWTLFGFLAQRGLYEPPVRVANLIASGTLTAAAVAIPVTNGSAPERTVRVIRTVYYANTTATVQRVTLKVGAIVLKTIDLAVAGSPGDTAEFNPGDGVGAGGQLTHQAGNASAVTYQVLGVN